jgi:hypothetical protein
VDTDTASYLSGVMDERERTRQAIREFRNRAERERSNHHWPDTVIVEGFISVFNALQDRLDEE